MELISLIRQGETLTAMLLIMSRVFVAFCCIPIHECAHAWVAHKLGDDTARLSGRMSLNPFVHFSPIGTVMILFFGIGYAKGVPVNPNNFKDYKKGFALTALAGPVSNLIMAFIALCFYYPIFLSTNGPAARSVALFFYYAASVNVSLAAFNFLPIPPLDGSRIFGLLLSDKAYKKYLQYENIIMIVVMVLLFTGVLNIPLMFINRFFMSVLSFIPSHLFGLIF